MRDVEELIRIYQDLCDQMWRELEKANRGCDDEEIDRVFKKWNYDICEKNDYSDKRRQKVLVLGGTRAKVSQAQLEMIIKELDMDIGQFEFKVDYEHGYDISVLKNSTSFSDIIVGEMDHSIKGKGKSSSGITELENHPNDYPNTIRCLNSSGKLELTKTSFRNALLKTNAYNNMRLGLELK